MALREKLDLLGLSEEQRKIAESKYMATLSLIDIEEEREILDYLNSEGTLIKEAREIKVLGNSKEEIAKKFNILGEASETDIYRQEPNMINRNVIDIYKKIKYCRQIGKSYKREDGTYEPFLFSESLWQKEFNMESGVKKTPSLSKPLEDSFVTVEPIMEQDSEEVIPSFDSPSDVVENDEVISETESLENLSEPSTSLDLEQVIDFPEVTSGVEDDVDHVDIKEYMKASEDMAELEARTTNFETVRKELESQLAELDALKNLGEEEEISFNDLEPESYRMGRAA